MACLCAVVKTVVQPAVFFLKGPDSVPVRRRCAECCGQKQASCQNACGKIVCAHGSARSFVDPHLMAPGVAIKLLLVDLGNCRFSASVILSTRIRSLQSTAPPALDISVGLHAAFFEFRLKDV